MKKTIRILSTTLAASLILGLSGGVFAQDKLPDNILKYLDGEKTIEEANKFYQSWTNNTDYLKNLEEANQAYDLLKADAEAFEKLATTACEAKRNLLKLEKVRSHVATLISLATKVVKSSDSLGGVMKLTDGKLEDSKLELVAGTKLFKEDWEALKKAKKENLEASKQDLTKTVGEVFTTETFGKKVEKSYERYKEIYEKVMDKDYQEAVSYLAENFSESVANETLGKIQASRTKQKGIVAFANKIAQKYNVNLGACAIGDEPVEKAPSMQNAKKESSTAREEKEKKDFVPNTGAHR